MSKTYVAQNLEQADLKVKKAFATGAMGYESTYQKVFNIETPQRYNERFVLVQTDSAVQEVTDGAAFPTQNIKEIGANEITVGIYKSAIPISDLTMLFDNYGSVAKIAATRGYHFKQKTDQLCADFLNNGTATSGEYGINIAGITTSLFSATQPIGDLGLTQSNRVTGGLSKTTLNQARVLLRKMQDHDGMIANYRPSRLIVPPEETMNAWQLTQSPNEPESAFNNLNYLAKQLGIEVIEWPLLDSTTDCFLMAPKGDVTNMYGLRLEVKEMPAIRRVQDTNTGNWVYQMRMVLAPGVVNYLASVGIIT